MVSASLSYLFKVSYDPFHSNMGSSRHDWVVPYLRLVSGDAAVHNGNITIKHSHGPVLVIRIKKRKRNSRSVPATSCFKLQWMHYYRWLLLQTADGLKKKKKGSLRSARGRNVGNPTHSINDLSCKQYEMKYWVCLPGGYSDIVYRVLLVKGKGCGAALCNVTTLMDHIWWTVMIAPIVHREIYLIARCTHHCEP